MLTKLRSVILALLILVLYLFVSYFDFEDQVRQPDPEGVRLIRDYGVFDYTDLPDQAQKKSIDRRQK